MGWLVRDLRRRITVSKDVTDDGLRTACRIATEHPEHPLSAAVLCLIDEIARMQAVQATQGRRLETLGDARAT